MRLDTAAPSSFGCSPPREADLDRRCGVNTNKIGPNRPPEEPLVMRVIRLPKELQISLRIAEEDATSADRPIGEIFLGMVTAGTRTLSALSTGPCVAMQNN